jgi:cyclic pyranopterin phosphate synthase
MMPIQDIYGRTFKTLRVSLLSACNLGCIYCTESDDLAVENKKQKAGALNAEELAGILFH